MELFLTLLLASAALATPGFEPIQLYYHETVGIPEAARIKAAEEAIDFDGARIVGGGVATSEQFPFMGGLIITLASDLTSVCGSSLLTTTRLVTAAHCWFDGRQNALELEVVLGSLRLYSGGTRIKTNECEIHESYNPTTLSNDVAVIKIKAVVLSTTIKTIALASGTTDYVGQTAEAIGYGRIADNITISRNQTLSFVSLPVISNAECQRTFGNTVLTSTLCTSGANGKGICGGDAGGPLRIGDALVGILSFRARAGCTRGFPVGCARVTSFHSWITERLL